MKVFIAGGTGLLGAASAGELIAGGHQVKTIALPPLPANTTLPPEMEIIFSNYILMSDEEIKTQLQGCDAFVFAAGVDERVEFPSPVMPCYEKYNIEPVKRFLSIAKQVGVKRAVIMGSYFSHFAKKWPQMKLTEKHPYIRSRILQEEAALAFNGNGMDVMILELPYIFGTQPGRKPVWTFLIIALKKMKGITLYPRGGTTMVTVRQVAQAVAGALEKGEGGKCYPVGWYNMSWKQMLSIFHKYMGMPGRKIVTLPDWLVKMGAKFLKRSYDKRGLEPGLDPVSLVELQTADTYIDKDIIQTELGVTEDDIEAAIEESVKLSLKAINEKTDLIGMRAE